ncbi:MAG: ATP-binding protein [Flavobacteriaceae bacterium]|nr:ATP-binding protein [Flavobacteriaceae bacterium]MDH3795437.1 ATP-binding protein [Flavobacteriaceae bacterium]
MLEKYKNQFIGNSIQFVVLDDNGLVRESDNTCIPFKTGDSLKDFHPFFESLEAIAPDSKNEVTFNCVHLATNGKELITDLVLRREDDALLLVIYDLSQHYNEYQSVAQARNESIIQEQLIALKNIELEERERFKNQFIRNFSHEIRNPLTSIMSITQVLDQTDLDAEQKQMVQYLTQSNSQLRLLLEDILSISIISSGKLQVVEKEFNLIKLLDLLIFTYTTKAKEAGLKFIARVDDKLPQIVESDRLRVYQVLTNILDNAIKYTKKGQIEFTVQLNQKRANKANVRFEISDTGRGIPAEKLERIFTSFTQIYESDKEIGSGLGLSIVKGLLTLMGSEIHVTSEVDRGSRFFFDLNLKYPLPSSIGAVVKDEALDAVLRKNLKKDKYKLLLVEDDLMIQTVLFKFLSGTDRFYIELVSDGAKVMEEVVNTNYDLIVMDVNIPNIRGDQITRLIRDFPFKGIKDIPIIGVTGTVYEEDIAAYKAAGMNAVLPKPFAQEELLKSVFKYLR